MFPKWSKWICCGHRPSALLIECFSLKQYRAYYGAFKAVHEKNGTAEEIEDLRALRFLSVISIVDPWIFIIFRTSVFRMFFHKIFIRPLMYRNWHSNSCRTSMESRLWRCVNLSGKLRNISHFLAKNHDQNYLTSYILKTMSHNKTSKCIFKTIRSILIMCCHSLFKNQFSGVFHFE